MLPETVVFRDHVPDTFTGVIKSVSIGGNGTPESFIINIYEDVPIRTFEVEFDYYPVFGPNMTQDKFEM